MTAWRTSTRRVGGFGCSVVSWAAASVSGMAAKLPAADPVRSLAMTDVHLSPSGPPETILDPEPDDALEALRAALAQVDGRRDAVADVCARWPRFLDAWAQLGRLGRDDVEAYAYFRVGYHRGLDRLRQSGWRGSGYVRWRYETNRGFLRALDGLRAPPRRSASPTKRSVAPNSSASWTPITRPAASSVIAVKIEPTGTGGQAAIEESYS